MRHDQAFFDHGVVNLEAPHGQAGLEMKVAEVVGAFEQQSFARAMLAAKAHAPATGETHFFVQLTEHHDATKRRRLRGNEKTVIAPRHHTGNGAARIAA